MARWKVEDAYGIDMEEFNLSTLLFGTVVTATKKTFTVSLPDGLVQFRGKNFEYNKDGEPIGGTVKSFTTHTGAEEVYTVSGFNVAVKDFVKAAVTLSTADDHKLIVKMFSGDDYISGGDAGNFIYGFAGSDGLLGRWGKDYLSGGAGNDLLIGLPGYDILNGGGGADRFVYMNQLDSYAAEDSMDLIEDFRRDQGDKIDLSEMGDFRFIGETAFSGSAGELAFGRMAGLTVVMVDIDGNGVADFATSIEGEMVLKGTDFIL